MIWERRTSRNVAGIGLRRAGGCQHRRPILLIGAVLVVVAPMVLPHADPLSDDALGATERRADPNALRGTNLGGRPLPFATSGAGSAKGVTGSETGPTCGWSSGFGGSDLSSTVLSLATFDDGEGAALYAGGWFHLAGSLTVGHVAKWNGSHWSALSGPAGTGADDAVEALAVFDDGSGAALYAGGRFRTAGGVTANGVARWDGSAWSGLNDSSSAWLPVEVHALGVFDDGTGAALHAGGISVAGDGSRWTGVVKWTGASWVPLIDLWNRGADFRVNALAVFDDGSGEALYAGGESADGLTANHIARWDGSTWSTVAGPSGIVTNKPVATLAVFDDGGGTKLYAGGSFTFLGSVEVNRVAKWDGSTWSPLAGPLGTGVDGFVGALVAYDDGGGEALYAGGSFTSAGGVLTRNVAKWDGSAWSPVSRPSGSELSDAVLAFSVYDDGAGAALYAGGTLGTIDGVPVNSIAKWSSGEWSRLQDPAGVTLNGWVRVLATYDDGGGDALYAGGYFTGAGTVLVNHIARWDGSAWSPLIGPFGNGADRSIDALAIYDDGGGEALYAGGGLFVAGGLEVNRIAKWDGSAWSPLIGPFGTGVNNPVSALAVFDDGSGAALYAGGSFTGAGGVDVNYVAKWDGSAWSGLSGPLGTGTSDKVNALAVFDDGGGEALYAAGHFTFAGGVQVHRIAKWDGSAWSPLTGPMDSGINSFGHVNALTVFDDGSGNALYVGGWFAEAGGVFVDGIAKWNGSTWSALTAGTTVSRTIYSLAAYNDGGGPALYAGGSFTSLGGVEVNHVAKWDGAQWSVLSGPSGLGTDKPPGALVAHDDGGGQALWAGGDFRIAGGIPSWNVGRFQTWRCPLFSDGFESGDVSAWSVALP